MKLQSRLKPKQNELNHSHPGSCLGTVGGLDASKPFSNSAGKWKQEAWIMLVTGLPSHLRHAEAPLMISWKSTKRRELRK